MREIPLTQGYAAIVDDADFDELSRYKWHVQVKSHTQYAARADRSTGKLRIVRMHRQILGVTDETLQVDHANRNGLDNRRLNLRVCTGSQNQHNRRSSGRANRYGLRGVVFDKTTPNKPWRARISVNEVKLCLGNFRTPKEAATAYDRAAVEHFKEFAVTNGAAP